MDAPTFLDDLRDDHETELSRLGSSKAVYAFTAGEMDGDAVRAATARELDSIASVLAGWAKEADGDAAARFDEVATFAAEAAEELAVEAPAVEPGGPTPVTAEALEPLGDEVERAAGLTAALLVFGTLSEQLVGFFVGDADRAGAATFRELRDELRDQRDSAAELLAERVDAEPDRAVADETATAVVTAAYDWYVGTLEGMGVEPKNVC